MDKLQIVDTHVHFYDMKHPELFYAHWQPDVIHPILGTQTRKLSETNFLTEDYIDETKPYNVISAVHVQAAIGSKDPVKETEWLQSLANKHQFPQAIIAYANLKDPQVEKIIEKHCEYKNMRGIRDFSFGDYLVDSDFHRGFSLLEKYNLIGNVSVTFKDMDKLVILANKFPNIKIIIDHCGFPEKRSIEYFGKWQSSISVAAKADNIICKISGLGMGDNQWTIESIKPYIMHCIESFGIERCIWGSNWPIDKLWSSFEDVVTAYIKITEHFSMNDKTALFNQNATHLYRI